MTTGEFEEAVEAMLVEEDVHGVRGVKARLRESAGKGASRGKAGREPITSIAKVEADRGRKNSRVKGNRAELDVAEMFSRWCGEVVRRTPGSGGWSNAKFGVTADLVCANRAFPYHVECFSGDTLVLTSDGYKPIADVAVGDEVLSHTGRWRRVTSTQSSGVSEVLRLTHGASTEPILVTPDHPFETFVGGWEALRTASHTSHLTQVAQHTVSSKKWMSTVCKPQVFKELKTKCDCGCGARMSKIDGKGRSRKFLTGHNGGAQRTKLPDRVELDADFAYLLGLYIAEGHCDHDKVTWTFHKNETILHSFVASIVSSRFGVAVTCRPSKHTKAMAVIAASSNLSDTFVKWCGTGSRNKRLGWMTMLDDDRAWPLVRGLFQGDGHIQKDVAFYNTVSKRLAYDLQAMLLRLGVVSYVGVNAKMLYKVNVARSHLSLFGMRAGLPCRTPPTLLAGPCKHPFVIDASAHRVYFRAPIKGRQTKPIKVYNLSVENDESYVIQGNVVVHNCKHREGWALDDLVTGVRKEHDKSIVQWWKQCVESCPRWGNRKDRPLTKTPLLVFRRNRQPWLVMMSEDATLQGGAGVGLFEVPCPLPVRIVKVMLLEVFLDLEPVPNGLKNFKRAT